MDITLREVGQEDYARIMNIVTVLHEWHRLHRPTLYGPVPYLEDISTYDYCYGAFDGEQMVGVVLGRKRFYPTNPEDMHVHVTHLCVLPGHQGTHTGKALLTKVEELCVQDKGRYVDLAVDNENWGAIAFYLRQGYREYKRILYKQF